MDSSGLRRAWTSLAVLLTCTVASADVGPVLSLHLQGNNAELDLVKVLSSTWTVPRLCAGETYTLTGNYSLVGICTDKPPFSATVNIDGSAIYSPVGLADNFSVPIPATITATPGTHTFSVVFNGGTYSSSAKCADVLTFGLPSTSLKVPVVNCTEAANAASAAAAAAGDALTTAEGLDIVPAPTTDLQERLLAHRKYIKQTVQTASEAAAQYVLQQFG